MAQFTGNPLCFPAQAPDIESIAGQSKEIDEGIAKFVVEKRPLHPGWESVSDIANFLADLIPGIGHVFLRRVVLERNEHQRLACLRIGANDIGPRNILQTLLDALGDLLLDFARRRARPQCPYHHYLEGEIGILGPAKLEIGHHAADHQHDDQIGHHRAVIERPRRQIQRLHRYAC